jgi:hypothetical protein
MEDPLLLDQIDFSLHNTNCLFQSASAVPEDLPTIVL